MSLTLRGGRVIFSKGKFILEGNEVEQALSNHMEDSAAMLPQDAKKKSVVSA